MEVKMRATVTFEWEEDSKCWDDKPLTPEALLSLVRKYAKDDLSYILDTEVVRHTIEIVE